MKHKSAILQILHGERGQFDLMPNRKTKEYHKWLNEQYRIYEKLKKNLTQEFIGTIDALVDAIEFKNLEELDGHYLEGFKFGLLIGLEVISQDKDVEN